MTIITLRLGPAWQISDDDAETVREYDDRWEVRGPQIGKHDAVCRECGEPIFRGDERLSFVRTDPHWHGHSGDPDRWTQQGFIHTSCEDRMRHPLPKPAKSVSPKGEPRPAWIFPPDVIADIRNRAPEWAVHETVSTRGAGCHQCGQTILKGDRRLTFRVESPKGQEWQRREASIHFAPCTEEMATAIPEDINDEMSSH